MSGDVLPGRARAAVAAWRAAGETVVFTNGVFDLLHRGHVEYLEDAAALGDRLLVGVNSDDSVRRLKGPQRPLVPAAERAELLEALACVDLAVIFEDDTPERLIREVAPDVLAKGGSEPVANTPKEATEFLKVEIARWGKVIKMAKVSVQ